MSIRACASGRRRRCMACLTPYVVHPAAFTFKLPDNVSFAEGAMVEPFAVGMQAATKAKITPGDIAVVIGAGPIGIMVALAALAGGCSRVHHLRPRSRRSSTIAGAIRASSRSTSAREARRRGARARPTAGAPTSCSRRAAARRPIDGIFDLPRPGGCVVLVGMPVEPVAFDVVSAAAKEIRIETVFRYANVYRPRHRADRLRQGRPEAADHRHVSASRRASPPSSAPPRAGRRT